MRRTPARQKQAAWCRKSTRFQRIEGRSRRNLLHAQIHKAPGTEFYCEITRRKKWLERTGGGLCLSWGAPLAGLLAASRHAQHRLDKASVWGSLLLLGPPSSSKPSHHAEPARESMAVPAAAAAGELEVHSSPCSFRPCAHRACGSSPPVSCAHAAQPGPGPDIKLQVNCHRKAKVVAREWRVRVMF